MATRENLTKEEMLELNDRLHKAHLNGNLKEADDIVSQCRNKRYALHNSLYLACRTGNLAFAAKYLFQDTIDIWWTNSMMHAGTFLHAAAIGGNVVITELVLLRGLPITVVNKYGQTALQVADMFRKKEVVKMLIERGADKSVVDDNGDNASDLAAYSQNCVKILLDEGTSPNEEKRVSQTVFLEMNQELHQLVTSKIEEMKLTTERALQESIVQHRQQLQEYNERLQQQLHESNERQQQQLQELQVVIERVRQDNQQLHEITVRSEEMEGTIQQLNEEIQHLRIQADNPQWVIEREEIQMTQEVVGRGGWGEVKVGIFRGTRVAIKCLHELILSQYNLALFSREMDIASRVRHPNLLQFIGATRVGNPMIVAELMPTSLRKEMDKNPLTRPQILGIGRDVASALNYLHLWRPEPILHRDVGSPNVLLEPSGHNQWKGKLSDYGSANIQHQISSTVGPGNPAYAAPESRYPNDHSPAMDVYSFGVLLMEMVVHRPPPPTTREKDALIRTIQWAPMKALIQSCTQEGKERRPTTSDLLQELHRF